MRRLIPFLVFITVLGCKNRDINEGEEFRPREVHDSFNEVNFSKVEVDGIEYLMLERDNNNPHEGFGFMAFRANKLISKQDSIIAHLRTMNEIQSRIYARMFGLSQSDADSVFRELFNSYLQLQQMELSAIETENLEGLSE